MLELCPSGSTEEHLTTDQRVVGSNPISDVFVLGLMVRGLSKNTQLNVEHALMV